MGEPEQPPDWDAVRRKLASGEWFDVAVTGNNLGGLLTTVEGILSFVPLSQVLDLSLDASVEIEPSALTDMIGRTLRVRVIEVNERRGRVILSERPAPEPPSE